MITIDLSKQEALDADPKTVQQINFTGNQDRAGGGDNVFHYWGWNFRFFRKNYESIVNLF